MLLAKCLGGERRLKDKTAERILVVGMDGREGRIAFGGVK